MAKILIVDDEPINRELLQAYLEGPEHELLEAESGERAIAIAEHEHPDLVLLDVMMPGLDGFETTRRLKAQAGDEYLPIILVTALADRESRVLGLKAGADEFLTKPVDGQEISLRVANLLALRAKEKILQEANLQHAELHRLKDELSSLIVHDIKNPLTTINGNLAFVMGQQGALSEDAQQALEDTAIASNRILALTSTLLEVARLEGGHLNIRRQRTQLRELVEAALAPRTMMARLRDIELRDLVDRNVEIEVDADLITRVFENIVDNSLRYAGAGGVVELSARSGSQIELRVGNTGAAIPSELRTRLFDKFGRGVARASRINHGLGLYFCRIAVEAHGGRIWIEETPELPTVFALQLPRAG